MKYFPAILLVFAVSACSKQPTTGNINPGPPPAGGPVKTWLALGDSYTIGQGVLPMERFAPQTANLLKQNGININAPEFIATTGWTTSNLSSAIQAQNPGRYDVVSLLIGVNDQYQTHDTTGYRQRFSALLSKAIELVGGKNQQVFVLSIPDYSVTPFAAGYDTARIRMEIDQFNAINQSAAAFFNCPYLNITPSTREARFDRSLLAADGLHPSGLEYRRWANRLFPLMQPVLQ